MKVLFVTGKYPPEYSGAGKQASLLREELLKNNIACDVFSKSEIRTNLSGQKNIIRIKLPLPDKIEAIIQNIILFIYLVINNHKYDCIHLHTNYFLFGTILFKKIFRIKTILKITGEKSDSIIALKSQGLIGSLKLKFINSIDVIVCVSRTIYNSTYDKVDTKSIYVPNGTRIIKINQKHVPLKLIHMGGSRPGKNLKFIVKSLSRIPEKYLANIYFYILGPMDYSREYTKETLNLLNEIKIKYEILGFVENVEKYLTSSDIFISASKYEGLPNSLLQACGAGLIPIVSDIPPHKEIFDNISGGKMFSLNEPQELAKQILHYLHTKNFSVEKKSIQNDIIRHYDISEIAREYMELYEI